jgi:hypothetical protein
MPDEEIFNTEKLQELLIVPSFKGERISLKRKDRKFLITIIKTDQT